MSTKNPSHGQKATDPNAIIRESAGPVASDSLAAESDTFSQNRNGAPQSVSDSSLTFANTNTSGATRLDPASDAEARLAESDWAEEKKLGDASSTSYSGPQTSSQTPSGNGGTAPSYITSQNLADGKPKGKNLTGGFDSSDGKNASFNSEIGGKNDPGRLAEQKFERENAQAGNNAGFPRDRRVEKGTGVYDALGGDTSA